MKLNNILSKIGFKKGIGQNNKPAKIDDIKTKLRDKRDRPILILKLSSYLIISLLISGLMFTGVFVYTSIINSIGQIQSIVSFQSEARVQLIEFSKLEKIEEYWQKKTNTKLPILKRDPFTGELYSSGTSTPPVFNEESN